jgi:hypothetical protein
MSADNQIIIVWCKNGSRIRHILGDNLWHHFNPKSEGVNMACLYLEFRHQINYPEHDTAIERAFLLEENISTEYGVRTLEFDMTWEELEQKAIETAKSEFYWLQTEEGERNGAWIYCLEDIEELFLLAYPKGTA